MSVRFDRSEESGTIWLEGEIDIGCAAALKAALEESLAAGDGVQSGVRISLAEATGMDVTAVQLLWAAEREARAAGKMLALDGPVPEALLGTLRAAGFEGFPLAANANLTATPDANSEAGGGDAQRGLQG